MPNQFTLAPYPLRRFVVRRWFVLAHGKPLLMSVVNDNPGLHHEVACAIPTVDGRAIYLMAQLQAAQGRNIREQLLVAIAGRP